ncbi:late competence protein ComER [Bacillus sp. SM2101]|uniref:late competence protein ComER n=1 Tax=Bacillus sp. SM2101 TaxID=2805366 RepID=UPI001BDE8DD3|nr:late competence protein ComER [Bacillus sp. SM2101]
MNVGIIGTGNMGKVLIEAFIESKALLPSKLCIFNRTIEKAEKIRINFPEITVTSDAEDVINQSDIIFICVKPLQIHPLLQQISPCLTHNKCLVSITSPISVHQIESMVNCQVARVIPSITNRAFSGISLISFGESCSQHYISYINYLFSNISEPVLIEEQVTRVASDIVSCGPAFFSYLIQRFIDAAANETEITREQATTLATGMIIGMGELLQKDIFTLQTLQEKVCVKGGVTGVGIAVLEKELGDMFEHLFQSTHDKFCEDIEDVHNQFI